MKKKLVICIVMVMMLLLVGCRSTEAEPTPDIDATVDARLTEAANQAAEPTETNTPEPAEPEPTEDVSEPICTVVSNSLNLRTGPGTVFDVITVLAQGAEVVPQKMNQDGSWLWVEAEDGTQIGWVSAAAQYVDCAIDVAALPVDAGPPTPTFTPVPEVPPTPTYTPTAIAQVIIPRAGGGDGDLRGDVFTLPQLVSGPDDFPTFSENLSLQVAVYDPNANQGDADGAGIDRVEITIRNADEDGDAGDTLLYSTTESTPAFCSFGGNGPCEVLQLGRGATWPGSDRAIESGTYSINFRVVPKRSDSEGGDWRIRFRIQRPGDPPQSKAPDDVAPNPASDIVANIVEVTRDGGLVFQVEAFNPAVGNNDGDGIDSVELRILGPNGREVYRKTEENAAYCAFGGDRPCPIGDISLERGEHTLRAIVFGQDGRTASVETKIVIE